MVVGVGVDGSGKGVGGGASVDVGEGADICSDSGGTVESAPWAQAIASTPIVTTIPKVDRVGDRSIRFMTRLPVARVRLSRQTYP